MRVSEEHNPGRERCHDTLRSSRLSAGQPSSMEVSGPSQSWIDCGGDSARQLQESLASSRDDQQQVMSPSRDQAAHGGNEELLNATTMSMMAGPGFMVNNMAQILMTQDSLTALNKLWMNI